jgi:hypothetical protein
VQPQRLRADHEAIVCLLIGGSFGKFALIRDSMAPKSASSAN